MKKIALIIIPVVMAVADISVQNVFFPAKEGLTLVYANLNAKGRAESYTQQTVRRVEGTDGNLSVSYVAKALDKNRKPVGDNSVEIPYTVTVRNGTVEWDMKSFAASGTESFIEITGDKLRIPSSLSPGDKLDDVTFTLTVNMGFKIRTEVSLTGQECLAVEDVTVPAGTFKCHKVTQTSAATVMRKTVVTKIITWYAPGIGTVKSETYSEKGKLLTATELQSTEN
jgi:hypothetical protein